MTKTFNNLSTYIIILVFLGFLITGIQKMGVEVVLNENSVLDNNSIQYIADINGINLSYYDVPKDELEEPIYINENASQGNPKDFGLEFLFTREKGLSIENKVKAIYEAPSTLLFGILKLPVNDWAWIINIITWMFTISILIMFILFARGVTKQ